MDTEKKPKFSIRLIWLFGLVSTDIIRRKEKPTNRNANTQIQENASKPPSIFCEPKAGKAASSSF